MAEYQQLTKRLILSVFLIVMTAYTIFRAPAWLFIGIVEIFIMMALSEYFDLAEKKGFVLNRYLGMVFAFLFPLSYYIPAESIIFMAASLCIFLFNFNRRFKDQALISTSLTLFGLFYVAWFFSFLTKIRWLPDGHWWIFYTIFVVKSGDAGAYFIGKKFGKHKFAAHISPQKSIEGAVGGLVVSVAASLGSKIYLSQVPLVTFLGLGLVVGVLAQLGDLAESLIKREVGVKDSGKWPGLGGVLDVIDSLLLTIPAIYYFVLVFQSGSGI